MDGDNRDCSNFDVIYSAVYKELSQAETITPQSSNGSFQELLENHKVLMPAKKSVFAYGHNLSEPIQNIQEANFNTIVKQSLLNKNYRSVFSIQTHSWQEILNGRSVTIVNGRKSGKTMAYLPALLSQLLDEKKDDDEDIIEGPRAIILIKSSWEVEAIYQLCKTLVTNKLTITKTSGMWNIEKNFVELQNSCDLLITTPKCFIRLSEINSFVMMFNRDKIKHLVLENMDMMYDRFEADILKVLKSCTRGTSCLKKNPQIIITATCWQAYLHEFSKLSLHPITIIGDFVESALFVKSRFIITRKPHHEKINQLLDYLSLYEWRTKRTVIIFNDQDELDEFKGYLIRNAISYDVLDITSKIDYIQSLQYEWAKESKGRMNLLLLHDDLLSSFNFECVQVLIHYSLPSSWSAFTRRFRLSVEYYMQYLSAPQKDSENEPLAIVTFDLNNIREIPRMVNFLCDRRLVRHISPEIRQEIDKIVQQEEEKLNSEDSIVPLCTQFLKFSACSINKCEYRHAFISADKPVNIPTSGFIKFKFSGMRSPIHFSIIITDHFSPVHKEWISFEDKIAKTKEKLDALQKYMEEESHQVMAVSVNVGDVCAYFNLKVREWCRCKIVRKEKNTEPYKPFTVEVILLDKGGRQKLQSTQLMLLPNDIKSEDPLVTDLRITNLVPYDFDELFDRETKNAVETFLRNFKDYTYLECKIELALDRTIITKDFEFYKKLSNRQSYIFKLSMKNFLVGKKYALEDCVFPRILEYATKAGFEIDIHKEEECSEKVNQKTDELIEGNVKDLLIGKIYDVHILNFVTPELFYVRIKTDKGKDLNEKMRFIANYSYKTPLTEHLKGSFCLAEKDAMLVRAVIISEEPLKIFLVDKGVSKTIDSKSKLYKIPKELIDLVPFQAIGCKLKGAKIKNNWTLQSSFTCQLIIQKMLKNEGIEMKIHYKRNDVYIVSLINTEKNLDFKEEAIRKNLMELDEEGLREKQDKLASENLMKLLEDNECVCLDNIEMNQMIGLPPTARFIPSEKVTKSVISEKKKKSVEIDMSRKGLEDEGTSLKSLYEVPQIEWLQNDVAIMMKIEATDAQDYVLNISEIKFRVLVKYENKWAGTAHMFYGRVQPQHVAHRMSGNLIYIYLLKKNINVKWPRLTFSDKRNNSIKCAFEELKVPYEKFLISEMDKWLPEPDEFYDEFEDELENDEIA